MIHENIQRKHYVATEAEVEALAGEQYTAMETAGAGGVTFLRVLVAASQARLGRRRGPAPRASAQSEVLELIYDKFYPAVLRGITTDDIAHDPAQSAIEQRRRALERNRRSAFARSAISTLRPFVAAGGDLRNLDVATVTKAFLRSAVAPPEPENKVERQISRAQGALLRAVTRMARGDPAAAEAAINAAIEALEGARPTAEQPAARMRPTAQAPRDTGTRRTRVGTPVMVHRPAA